MRLATYALLVALGGCGGGSALDEMDPDLGPIEATLTDEDRAAWPGSLTGGVREIPLIQNFGNGRPAAYWFLGLSSRRAADSFWFCPEGDDLCPLDVAGRLDWDTMVGHPMFIVVPGDAGYSPYWLMWKVTVPAGFQPETVKTLNTLYRLQALGRVQVDVVIRDFPGRGPQEVIIHSGAALAGTELSGNGGPMPDGSGPMLQVETRFAWNRGMRVEFFDFSTIEGVFPEALDSEARSLMPFARIYVHWRSCLQTPAPSICDLPSATLGDRRPVSERGLGRDITGDGDTVDTNNVVGGLPCEVGFPGEPAYSPLWKVFEVGVVPGSGVALIDTYGDQARTDINSAAAIAEGVAAGRLLEPIAQVSDSTGLPTSTDGAFFDCPAPVARAFVPCDPPAVP